MAPDIVIELDFVGKSSGILAAALVPFVKMVVHDAKQTAGPELVGKCIASVPAPKGLD